MWLRITLWAMLLGSIIMGYFGYQTGSTMTTFVGMGAIIFIGFLLFFLAKMTLSAGLVFVKVVVIILLIGGIILLCVHGCTILWQQGQMAVHKTTETFQDVKEKTFAIPGKLDTSSYSWWHKVKGILGGDSSTGQVLAPSKIKTARDENEKKTQEPQTITGKVSKVLSGTAFVINGITLKLYGIDAPDMSQTCLTKRSETYKCGRNAKKKLEKLLLNKIVFCQLISPYSPSKYYAICEIQGYDIGATMVSVGWAVADRKVTDVYIPYENQARQKNEGLWSGKFVAPWEYRQNKMGTVKTEKSGFLKGLFK